jgi:hypothetical protein
VQTYASPTMRPIKKSSESARKASASSKSSPGLSDQWKVFARGDFHSKSKTQRAFRSLPRNSKRPIFDVQVESRGSILSTFRNRPFEILGDFAPRATRSGKYLHHGKNSRVESATPCLSQQNRDPNQANPDFGHWCLAVSRICLCPQSPAPRPLKSAT